jgi:enoyl-CoA hydratase/carnithine racemase
VPQTEQFTLSNGLTLIVKPDRRAPTAVHMLWVRVGAMDEVDGTSGVAHVLEHMMFKGTDTLAPGEFSRRVAALGGRENAFTARDYTGYFQQIPSQRLEDVMRLEADEMAAFLRLLERVCARLHDHPAPVVAAVNGHAIAGGAVLAACCDHRVGGVDPKARIGLNEVALGLRFPPGILRILQARLPAQHHGALLLGAGLHAPADALRLGLLDELADDPVATAGARLQALAAHPPAAFAATKAALRAGVTSARPGEAEAADHDIERTAIDASKAAAREFALAVCD